MDKNTLECIKSDYENIQPLVVEYLTKENSIYTEEKLKNKDVYELFSLYLDVRQFNLSQNAKEEAKSLTAAKIDHYGCSLGWMKESWVLLSKDFKKRIWGRTADGGTYSVVPYTLDEQAEIEEFLKN